MAGKSETTMAEDMRLDHHLLHPITQMPKLEGLGKGDLGRQRAMRGSMMGTTTESTTGEAEGEVHLVEGLTTEEEAMALTTITIINM